MALCGSGVGASIAANKVAGVRAGRIHDVFSAHQGVEDDDVNVFCLGGQVIGPALAWELVENYAMAKRGALKVTVIGVAFPKWSLERLRKHVMCIDGRIPIFIRSSAYCSARLLPAP